jgi:nucleoside transporter
LGFIPSEHHAPMTTASVDGWLRFRLSTLMFLHYFAMGAWIVPLATYLSESPVRGGLGFSPVRVGLIYSTTAVAGMVAPLFIGLLADRLFRSDRLLVVLNLAAGGFLLAAGVTCRDADPGDPDATFARLYGFWLAYSFCLMVCNTLASSVTLRNLHHPERHFSGVRLFGTVGWIVAGWAVSFALRPMSPDPVFLAGGAAVVLGLFCLLLPHTPPIGTGRSLADALGVPALGLFRDGSFAVMIAAAFMVTITQAFYNLFGNRYLTELGAPAPAALQTIAQFAEVGCMLLVAPCLARFGVRGMMMLGLAGWTVRFAVLATGDVPAIAVVALPLHGLSFSFFFLVAALYIDRLAPRHLRAAAQGINGFVTLGVGSLAGNWLAGRAVESATRDGSVSWEGIWLMPALGSAVALLFFVVGFRPAESRPARVESVSVPERAVPCPIGPAVVD